MNVFFFIFYKTLFMIWNVKNMEDIGQLQVETLNQDIPVQMIARTEAQ